MLLIKLGNRFILYVEKTYLKNTIERIMKLIIYQDKVFWSQIRIHVVICPIRERYSDIFTLQSTPASTLHLYKLYKREDAESQSPVQNAHWIYFLKWCCLSILHWKNANRIPGFPWNLSFLILENTHCWLRKILHIAHPDFFLSPAPKSVPRPTGVRNSGLRNEIPNDSEYSGLGR